MNLWTTPEIISALSGELLKNHANQNFNFDEVVIDSRKITKNGLFIAIKGEKNDGHNFLNQTFENGCEAAIIEDSSVIEKFPGKDFFLVKDSFRALYKLAEFSRKRSKAKIIAVTGSVGKTSTKEMLKIVFSKIGKTFATQGNLNNHFGLPLSLCNFSSSCEFGIFEMGMNHFHEIEPLSKLAQPHLAIVTNVGPVHIENFKNEEEIALAKSEIFSGVVDGGFALVNRNCYFDILKTAAKAAKIKDSNIINFGEQDADYELKNFQIKNYNESLVKIKLKNSKEFSYKISSANYVEAFNSLVVAAALDLLKCDLEKGLLALENFQTPNGRGNIFEIKVGEKNILIIDDTYNASVISMKAGIKNAVNLKNILQKKRLVVALGDMLELGEASDQLHLEVVNCAAKSDIDFAIFVGEKMSRAAKNTEKLENFKVFSDSNAAAAQINDILKTGDILYCKGSRGTKMEAIIKQITNA